MFKRSITGAILGLTIIIGLLYTFWSAACIFLIILLFSTLEWFVHFTKKQGVFQSAFFISIQAIIGLLLLNLILVHEVTFPYDLILKLNVIVVFILFLFGCSLFLKTEYSFYYAWYAGIFYIGLPILVGIAFLYQDYNAHKYIILGLIILNWSNDTFAYITGRWIGKTLMAPDISPKKTIEGAFGGLCAAILAAWIVNEYLFIHSFPFIKILFLGIGVWLSGTIGDLYESKMKRLAGIKDSGNLLPGHGGFLDRFDSFFYIIPVGIFILLF